MGEQDETGGRMHQDMEIESGSSLGVRIPEILLPIAEIERSLWPVIACDQYTSQPDYWKSVEDIVGDNPSTCHLILPEVYLENPGPVSLPDRIDAINENMARYISEGILSSAGECMVLVDRRTPAAASRKGLVLSVDLEKYDYRPEMKNLIRATEGTVIERIPPRLKIRRNAPLEVPHVLLLVDDPGCTIIEPLAAECLKGEFELLYDLDLMKGGGHLRGYRIPDKSIAAGRLFHAMASLSSLRDYGLLFAVGDGNHSLATAKEHWNTIRNSVPDSHPARFALVELINIHDEGLTFEPIHRVLFDVDLDGFIAGAGRILSDSNLRISDKMSVENAILMAETIDAAVQPVPVFCGSQAVVFTFPNPPSMLAVGSMQILIDAFLAEGSKGKVDYIHGTDAVMALSADHIGMLLPAIAKDTFFNTIVNEGILPRKTFSMGEAFEKRFYMECKLIV